MSSNTNPFRNVIQLEEITHYEKPTKSILNLSKSFQYKIPKRVSYFLDKDEDDSEEDGHPSESPLPSPLMQSRLKESSPSTSTGRSNGNPFKNHTDGTIPDSSIKRYDELSESDSSESDTEFHRDLSYPHRNSDRNKGFEFRRNMNDAVSDENLFPVSTTEVTYWDMLFGAIVMVVAFASLLCDFTLTVWHYQTDLSWGCGLTLVFFSLGGIGMLHQFSLLGQDQLDRLFRKAKRVRILVNCFPPAASLIVSFESLLTAWRAHYDPMVSHQFLQIEELSKSIFRVQSFYQSAPQATLQLLIYMENFHETTLEKSILTFISITLSLVVMTIANLPSKSDLHVEDSGLHTAAYLPWTRLFVGTRMFSSFASRCMAITYLLVGCRCLLEPDTSSAFTSTVIALTLLIIPRLVFSLTDYLTVNKTNKRNLEHYREQPEVGLSSSHPISKTLFLDVFVGYLATIFIPVGDPLWLFWYLWCEAGIFIIFGNVAGMTNDCFDHVLNVLFSGIFFVVFVMIPLVIPFTKVLVHRQKIRKFTRVVQSVEDPRTDDFHIADDSSNNITNNNVRTKNAHDVERNPE